MFTKVSPSEARDESGCVVRIADRHAVELLEPGGRTAVVAADVGDPTVLYANDVRWRHEYPRPGAEERSWIVEQVRLGLLAMEPIGVIVEGM